MSIDYELAFIRDKETGKLVNLYSYTDETINIIESLLDVYAIEIVDVNKLYEENRQLKVQVADLEEWRTANQPTGICETCTDSSVQLNTVYKRVLQKARDTLTYYENVVPEKSIKSDSVMISYLDASGRETTTSYTSTYAREMKQEISSVLHPCYLDINKKS